jgi:WD40 repeat protein
VDEAPAADVHGLAVSPDGRTIVTKGTDDGLVRVWGADGMQKATIRAELFGGGHVDVSADGRHVYAVSTDHRSIAQWELPSGRESARFAAADPSATYVSIKRVRLSADGRRLAVVALAYLPGGESTTVTVWNTTTAVRQATRRLDDVPAGERPAVSPDLDWCYFDGRAVSVTGTGDLMAELPDGWTARQPVVSPDGRLVAWAVSSIHQEGSRRIVEPQGIWVHETVTGRRVFDLPRWDKCKLEFTPDGRGLVVADELGLTRWDLVTGTIVVRRPAPRRLLGQCGPPFASSLALFPDGTRAVTGHLDTTAIIWDIRVPARAAKSMSERELAAAWADLAGDDAAKAYTAIWTLADAPADAVPFLKARVRPVAESDEESVRKLVGRLDASAFAVRERADRELRRLGEAAVPTLRAIRTAELSVEQAKRVEQVLAAATTPVLPAGEKLRQVRAVAVLELAGTPQARALLAELASGAAGDRLTRDAAGALGRLARDPNTVLDPVASRAPLRKASASRPGVR